MSRPTRMIVDPAALLHNLNDVKRIAPEQKIMAIVKANAYGCGIANIVPFLVGQVESFGVASLDEAMAIRRLGVDTDCVLLQGYFDIDELRAASNAGFQCVIHHTEQLKWLLNTRFDYPFKVWVKVNTGMSRLGFAPHEVRTILSALQSCPWVSEEIGIMTHFSSADQVGCASNELQLQVFHQLDVTGYHVRSSLANSAAILSMKAAHADIIRPGIMLYGISPFVGQTGCELGLKPVVRLVSALSAIHHYPAHTSIGYSGTWFSDRPSIIGVVPIGYADGYPRHIHSNTPAWVNGSTVPIVGRISMDMMTLDLTQCPNLKIGDPVELWGQHIPIERIAESAGTIAYELLGQVTPRARDAGALVR